MRFSSNLKLPTALVDGLDVDFLVKSDARRPATELKDGRWLLLAEVGPVTVSEDGTEFIGHWHEIQHVVWESNSRMLLVRWVDPSRQPWHGVTVTDDPRKFMSHFEEYVEYSIVSSQRRKADNGTTITASIRRTEDGQLFSTLVADGPLDASGEKVAHELEAKLRESVGLPL
ncbi:MAG: hypothetical protein Q4D87_03430 [Actinomycetaceae bacterium]|nr:hypothetical protein [Actinomycetaceae bacterium]